MRRRRGVGHAGGRRRGRREQALAERLDRAQHRQPRIAGARVDADLGPARVRRGIGPEQDGRRRRLHHDRGGGVVLADHAGEIAPRRGRIDDEIDLEADQLQLPPQAEDERVGLRGPDQHDARGAVGQRRGGERAEDGEPSEGRRDAAEQAAQGEIRLRASAAWAPFG
ncbi:MAG: hypothetical protein QM820_44380 [Minicystis sp.]